MVWICAVPWAGVATLWMDKAAPRGSESNVSTLIGLFDVPSNAVEATFCAIGVSVVVKESVLNPVATKFNSPDDNVRKST